MTGSVCYLYSSVKEVTTLEELDDYYYTFFGTPGWEDTPYVWHRTAPHHHTTYHRSLITHSPSPITYRQPLSRTARHSRAPPTTTAHRRPPMTRHRYFCMFRNENSREARVTLERTCTKNYGDLIRAGIGQWLGAYT